MRLLQKFAQFVDGVVVVQEVDAVRRAELGVGPLNLHEEVAQLLLQLGGHDRRFNPQLVLDVGDVLVVLVVAELFQNLLNFLVRDGPDVDPLLLDLRHDVV